MPFFQDLEAFFQELVQTFNFNYRHFMSQLQENL